MIKSINGNKMFIADLILTSTWAFFFSRYCSSGVLLLILIRIALCFEMQRKSPWTLVSAIGFLISYASVPHISKPFERMFYVFFCYIGQSELMVEIFSEPFEWEMEAWIASITALWFIWIAIMPIFVGFRQHNTKKIQWKRKWIWGYFIPLSVFFVWVMFTEGSVGGILEGWVIAFLPVVYWSIYERKGRSAVQLVIEENCIRTYFAYTLFMLLVLTIGLKDISSLKFIGVIVLPPLLYIMLTKTMRTGIVLTRNCIALSISGWLYWLTLDTEQWLTFVSFGIAFFLIGYVGVITIIRTKKWAVSLVLMFALPIVVIPGILGLNPYVVTEADYTRLYLSNLSVRNGVYVVEKYFERAEKGEPYYWGRKYGLRDRYGLILPIKYTELKPVDRYGRYISINLPVKYGVMIADQRYGVYDLRKRKFVVDPENLEIAEMEKIDDRSFKLINPDGRYFATLYLPGEYRGGYFPDAHLEPHFADGKVPVAEFLEMSENVNFDIEDKYWKEMRKENPHAYKLLVQLATLGSVESSPVNDMNHAKAIREIIQKDSYYKGNITKALDDTEKLSETITDSGSQSDINVWTEYLRLISSMRTSLAYDALMSAIPDNKWIDKEYVAWHNLLESMAYYLDYLFSAESYLAVPEERNIRIKKWLDYRRECIELEHAIISDNKEYAVSPQKNDSIRGKTNFDELFSHFHNYFEPYYYHPMWNEIKVAFDEWIYARNKIAEQLEPHPSLSYREHSREVVDSMFSVIETFDKPSFRPALYK